MTDKIVEEKSFSERIREFLLREKGIDIEDVDCIGMPENRENYNLDNIIGNVNLVAGRFRTKKEANIIVDEFLAIPLP